MLTHCIYFLISTFFVCYTKAGSFDVTTESVLPIRNSHSEPPSFFSANEVKKRKNYLKGACDFPVLKPIDCEQLLQLGYNQSGVYDIWPNNKVMNSRPIRVFCDMQTDNGGWTVIQRRGNFLRPTDYFYKDWANYKSGFGNIEEEFWLGNDNIFAMTNQKQYAVRFDLIDLTGGHRYALYDDFFIESEENKYRLTIQEYSGTANDSMISSHNGQKFTTKDQDNDTHKDNCAKLFKGGWWYSACHAANLNGLNFRSKHESYADGINWHNWKGYHESLAKTEIKIRPKDFLKTLML